MSNKNYNIWFKNKRKRKTVGEILNLQRNIYFLSMKQTTCYRLPTTIEDKTSASVSDSAHTAHFRGSNDFLVFSLGVSYISKRHPEIEKRTGKFQKRSRRQIAIQD